MENYLRKEFIYYIKGKVKIRFIFYLINIRANLALDIFLLIKYSSPIFYEAPCKAVSIWSK